MSAVQIEQDIALCAEKFPALICRPLAAQFMAGEVIALFEFEDTEEGQPPGGFARFFTTIRWTRLFHQIH